MKRHYFLLTAVVVATTLTYHPVTAAKPGATSPTIVDLGQLGGGFSDAFGINNDPNDVQVVGHSTRPDGFAHGFLWTAATGMIDLGSLGRSSFASDVNDHGVIAGRSEAGLREHWAVIWTRSSSGWAIQKLNPLVGTCCGSANALNNRTGGDPSAIAVVGSSSVPSGGCSIRSIAVNAIALPTRKVFPYPSSDSDASTTSCECQVHRDATIG